MPLDRKAVVSVRFGKEAVLAAQMRRKAAFDRRPLFFEGEGVD